MATWHADRAWVDDQVMADVLLEARDGVFTRVDAGVPRPPDVERLAGFTLPGLVNTHSHAFHRALRGRTHGAGGDFWRWREHMYALTDRLTPELYHALARACFAEMVLAGITSVGEFHYLHRPAGDASGSAGDVMAEALRAAAADAGLHLTLLDTLYLQGDVDGGPCDRRQRRFASASVEEWEARIAARAAAWAADPGARAGYALHSVRAVPPSALAAGAAAARRGGGPLHVHVSEQPAENRACRAAHGCSPTELLARCGVLGPGTTAVHATHVTPVDLDLLARHEVTICLCPTTERDLADGVAPGRELARRGVPTALGSDSQAVVDLFEEARAVELNERAVQGTRGGIDPAVLWAGVGENGARAVGRPEAGRLAVGRAADFATVGLGSVRLAGTPAGDVATGVLYAATAADVDHVVVAGRSVVRGGAHLLIEDVAGELATVCAGLDREVAHR